MSKAALDKSRSKVDTSRSKMAKSRSKMEETEARPSQNQDCSKRCGQGDLKSSERITKPGETCTWSPSERRFWCYVKNSDCNKDIPNDNREYWTTEFCDLSSLVRTGTKASKINAESTDRGPWPNCSCKRFAEGTAPPFQQCSTDFSMEAFKTSLKDKKSNIKKFKGHLLGYPFACEVPPDSACKYTWTFEVNGEQRFASPFACTDETETRERPTDRRERQLHAAASRVCKFGWFSITLGSVPTLLLGLLQVYLVLHFVQLRCSDSATQATWDAQTEHTDGRSDWDEFSDGTDGR
jgi:hypothetical protein